MVDYSKPPSPLSSTYTSENITKCALYAGEAVCSGHHTLCEALVAGVGASELLDRSKAGFSLLHVAAGLGEPMGVKWLLGKDAAVNDAACPGRLTPLHCAALSGSVLVVELLLGAGADASARCALHNMSNMNDNTPLISELALRLICGAA